MLDAACGTGRYALLLAEAGARVSGTGATPEMLAELKSQPGIRQALFIVL